MVEIKAKRGLGKKRNMTSLRGRKVLVTGAGGFIGSHLIEALINRGARVRAFVRYTSRGETGMLKYLSPAVLREVEIIYGDIRDAEAISLAAAAMEIICHLGALIGIPYSYLQPRDVAETNIFGTLNVLMAARRHGVQRVIHTSTSEVYGSAQTVPITERHPLHAQSPYSASKIAADKLAESFYCSYGTPVCILRPFNTYGPRQSDRAVIPTIISQALKRAEIHLGSLTTQRDYTFVEDTVNGFIKAAEQTALLGVEINLGNDQEISIGDLARKILTILDCDLPIIEDKKRLRPEQSEVERLRASNARAKELLGWEPNVSLDEGLRKTIRWIEEYPGLYQPSVYRV